MEVNCHIHTLSQRAHSQVHLYLLQTILMTQFGILKSEGVLEKGEQAI